MSHLSKDQVKDRVKHGIQDYVSTRLSTVFYD